MVHTISQLKSGSLNHCKHITLSEQLTDLPIELLTVAGSLEILDISHNQLSTLPDWLPQLSKLRIIFASNNQFEHLPDILGACPKLEMIGFKANKIRFIAENSLPTKLRWLTLTDNCLEKLPNDIGSYQQLEKLLLAGNQLTELPESITRLKNLQLLRISANQLISFPEQVMSLPKLAWFAFAGNPFTHSNNNSPTAIPKVASTCFKIEQELGQGASGVISKASWIKQDAELATEIAIKKFKGGVTSDGYPSDELHAYLHAGSHPNIVESIAYVDETDNQALVMKLIPDNYKNLGLPPTFISCTRDVFAEDVSLSITKIDKVIGQINSVFEHLHNNKVAHGDIYCHNTLIDEHANILFGDFGAASLYSMLSPIQQQKIKQIEQRALDMFIDDLLSICIEQDKQSKRYQQLKQSLQN